MHEKLAVLPASSNRRLIAGTVWMVCVVGTAAAIVMLPPVWALVVGTVVGALALVATAALFLVWANAWVQGKSPSWEQALSDFVDTCESARLPVPPLF